MPANDDGDPVCEFCDEPDQCDGHESLRGDSMGATTFCDGQCDPVAHFKHPENPGEYIMAHWMCAEDQGLELA